MGAMEFMALMDVVAVSRFSSISVISCAGFNNGLLLAFPVAVVVLAVVAV